MVDLRLILAVAGAPRPAAEWERQRGKIKQEQVLFGRLRDRRWRGRGCLGGQGWGVELGIEQGTSRESSPWTARSTSQQHMEEPGG